MVFIVRFNLGRNSYTEVNQIYHVIVCTIWFGFCFIYFFGQTFLFWSTILFHKTQTRVDEEQSLIIVFVTTTNKQIIVYGLKVKDNKEKRTAKFVMSER